MSYRVDKHFCLISLWQEIRKFGLVTLTFKLWPWNSTEFMRL